MKIESVRAVLTGHRILNPEMQRSWALVRIETDTRYGRLGRSLDELGSLVSDRVPGRGRGRLLPSPRRARPARHP